MDESWPLIAVAVHMLWTCCAHAVHMLCTCCLHAAPDLGLQASGDGTALIDPPTQLNWYGGDFNIIIII